MQLLERPPIFSLLIAITCLSAASARAQVTSTFRVGSGNWGVNTNWTNVPFMGGFPNNGNAGVATYDAVVNSGTATLDQNIAIQKVTQSGGTVNGAFNLTANDLWLWSAGTLDGTGTSRANAALAMRGILTLLQRRFEPMVSSVLSNGSLTMASGAVFTNKNGVTFTLPDDSSLFAGSGGGSLLNDDIFQKTGAGNNASFQGVNLSVVNVGFTNSGKVCAAAGTLGFQGSYIQTAGSTVLTGGVLSASIPVDIRGGSLMGTGLVAAANVTNNGSMCKREAGITWR